ncbi:UDP-N-acetylmuramate dehydrogenase [Kitasatospora acidiphila]|uniref:UDP-N-acetylmuramate dehydrogenase n=1 Tax=Kitasatospora acidiphila TaxID=2567942 RepID=UPI000C70AA99|nr:UDP-N-acetylmuramate dehydrogenase [Kitasatospora sp. GP30]
MPVAVGPPVYRGPVHVTENAPLAPLTTLRLGGPARRLVTARTDQEVIAAVQTADAVGEPLLVIGGGSNLVIGDDGFEGTVLRIATTGFELDGTTLELAAGENWADAVQTVVLEHGLAGVEFLAGIPGSAGATPVQNVGAYGQEVAQTITEVVAYDRVAGEVVTLSNAECVFSYRHSRFKAEPDRWVVLRVRLGLADNDGLSTPIRYAEVAKHYGVEQGERVDVAAAWNAVLLLRAGKGMVLDEEDHDTWSAGSFFTNPILTPEQYQAFAARLGDLRAPAYPAPDGHTKTSAAWLIDHAGFKKGYGSGPATLSTKHTLALTNRGRATTADLLALAREIRAGVHAAFGVELVNEPVFVGVEL